MVKKIIAMLMTLLLIASAGMGAFAISAEQLDSLLSYAVDAGKSTFVAALPYICSDYGINMLKDSLDTYLSGGDAGLFQGVFESLTERVEGETIKKLLNSLKYVDQDVRESVQKTCQSNLSIELNHQEEKGAEAILAQLIKKNGRFMDVFDEYDITPGTLASYLSDLAPLGAGKAMLKWNGETFSLQSYDASMCDGINSIWREETPDFDIVAYMKQSVTLLNSVNLADREDIFALLKKTDIAEGSSSQSGNNKPTPGGHGGDNAGTTPIVPPVTEKTVPFTDIENAWGKAYIESLYLDGIINGVTETLFMPDATITREAFVKLIVELFDLQAQTNEMPFADVQPETWYYPYIAAAYENHIINGVSETEFGVGANIRRQDMAKIIDTILQNKEIAAQPADEAAFVDYAQIADYAKEAVLRMGGHGIISGDENGYFNPQNFATRQEAAKMIYGLKTVVNR